MTVKQTTVHAQIDQCV